MQLTIKPNLERLNRKLSRIQRQQLPFIYAETLTDTVGYIRTAEVRQIIKDLDRPTKFTKNSFYIKAANKREFVAKIGIKDIQAKYLHWQIEGGTRQPGKKIPVPFNAKLNQYGNMSRRYIEKILARSDTFVGTVKGVSGIWQRGHISKKGKFTVSTKKRGTNIKLLVAFEKSAKYKKRFHFFEVAQKTARTVFVRQLNKNTAKYLKG